jgi:hypothetical protein
MADIEQRLAALEAEVQSLRALIEAKTPAKKRAHALPLDWQPRPEDVKILREAYPNLDINHETDSFRDYWAANGKPAINWHAAYRNWLRKAAQFSKARVATLQGRSAGRAASLGEDNRARRDRALDKLAQIQQGAGARKA